MSLAPRLPPTCRSSRAGWSRPRRLPRRKCVVGPCAPPSHPRPGPGIDAARHGACGSPVSHAARRASRPVAGSCRSRAGDGVGSSRHGLSVRRPGVRLGRGHGVAADSGGPARRRILGAGGWLLARLRRISGNGARSTSRRRSTTSTRRRTSATRTRRSRPTSSSGTSVSAATRRSS